jgi:hypothetical protein
VDWSRCTRTCVQRLFSLHAIPNSNNEVMCRTGARSIGVFLPTRIPTFSSEPTKACIPMSDLEALRSVSLAMARAERKQLWTGRAGDYGQVPDGSKPG